VVQDQIGGESWPGSSNAFERTRSLSCGASRPEDRPSGRSLDPGREAGARGMIVTVRASKLAPHRIRLTGSSATSKDEIKEPSRIDFYDEVQTRRAYFLTDLDQFEKAIPILEEVKNRRSDDTNFLFYLGHCYFRAKRWGEAQHSLERALALSPRPRIAFQAHGSLGMVLYETGDYRRAKQELETSAKLAAPDYIKHAHIWKWLENTCISLGLKEEARRYGQLARPS
jgi:predicted Zn-dependent protease